jgi:hypothetical protein
MVYRHERPGHRCGSSVALGFSGLGTGLTAGDQLLGNCYPAGEDDGEARRRSVVRAGRDYGRNVGVCVSDPA